MTKAGKAAQHIADTMLKPAHGELGSAQKDEGGAHLDGFSSKASLDTVIDIWQPTTSGLQDNVHGTGGKLLSTSNTYVSTDNAAVDLFNYVPPVYDNHHPMPR
ncbi:MAG: hypothetical protein J2P24_02665 [Streptosporangiales bacterium]|nr:hypothetical protein [Streptosporangiales bacterium]